MFFKRYRSHMIEFRNWDSLVFAAFDARVWLATSSHSSIPGIAQRRGARTLL